MGERRDLRAARLTHAGPDGEARMVDVAPKVETARRAVAEATVRMSSEAFRALVRGTLRKGNPLEVVRLAGILAAKRTAELIPLCHPLRLDAVEVRVEPRPPARIRIEAEVRATDRTGVEMEALTAAAVASLALYDMLKAVDRGVEIRSLVLLEKEGGRSGHYRRGRGRRGGGA